MPPVLPLAVSSLGPWHKCSEDPELGRQLTATCLGEPSKACSQPLQGGHLEPSNTLGLWRPRKETVLECRARATRGELGASPAGGTQATRLLEPQDCEGDASGIQGAPRPGLTELSSAAAQIRGDPPARAQEPPPAVGPALLLTSCLLLSSLHSGACLGGRKSFFEGSQGSSSPGDALLQPGERCPRTSVAGPPQPRTPGLETAQRGSSHLLSSPLLRRVPGGMSGCPGVILSFPSEAGSPTRSHALTHTPACSKPHRRWGHLKLQN